MGYLRGEQVKPRELARLCHDRGWRDSDLVVAVATCLSESQGYDRAFNDNVDAETGKTKSRDVGLFQINIPGREVGGDYEQSLYDPGINVDVAFRYWTGRGFQPWYGYTKGYATDPLAKGQYIQRAVRGVANFYAMEFGLEPKPFFAE